MCIGARVILGVAADDVVWLLLSLIYEILVPSRHRSHEPAPVIRHVGLLIIWPWIWGAGILRIGSRLWCRPNIILSFWLNAILCLIGPTFVALPWCLGLFYRTWLLEFVLWFVLLYWWLLFRVGIAGLPLLYAAISTRLVIIEAGVWLSHFGLYIILHISIALPG